MTARGPGGERLAIRGLFLDEALDAPAAAALLAALLEEEGGGLAWAAPRRAAPGVVRARGRGPGREGLALLTWRSSAAGTALGYYRLSGPPGSLAGRRQTWARILASFRLAPPGRSAGASRALRYLRWREPEEGAFTLEVPEGWAVRGEVGRASAVDLRPWSRLRSPDGAVEVFSGDPRIPPFREPVPMDVVMGLGEGMWYSPGYGVRLMIRRYLPGTAFLQDYLPLLAADGWRCVPSRQRARPDVAEAQARLRQRLQAQAGGPLPVGVRDDAGEAWLRCQGGAGGGRAARGYLFVQTRLTQGFGLSQWQVVALLGYLAPASREEEAREVLARLVAGTRPDPRWLAMQSGTTAATARIVAETNRAIARSIGAAYAGTQAAQDRAMARGARGRRGVERVLDPRTGQVRELASGPDYWWIDAQGRIAGTRTPANPDGLRFEELIPLDR
ncbi:MAG: hypothetical protein D6809_02125 [Gammaproteobacteria bacterium]|nr:MAG: hypothetical protein D6809_02125 [Gammaproteobacteria bacterium]